TPQRGAPNPMLALPDSRPKQTPATPQVPYQISQRAQHVSVDVSHRVRFGGRPILNLRDEPLAGGRYRRLHIIIGDANRSQYPTALKLGTTALVAQLLELGWDSEIELENPVAALKEIARNPFGGWTVRTSRNQ